MTFKKGDKVFVEFEVLDTCHSSEYMLVKDKSNQTRQFLKSEAQILPKKVVIPKFVAEWIEVCADFKDASISLGFALSPAVWEANSLSDKCTNWLYSSTNQNIFARAWLDGCEIEQEQRYTVKIPNPNIIGNECLVLMRNGFKQIVAVNKIGDGWRKEKAFQLTEAEIKKDFVWAWEWAEPVEEGK